MQAQIQKWGNSLGVRIPKAMAQALYLKPGVKIDMSIQDNNLVIHHTKSELELLLDSITEENLHNEVFDDTAVKGKEVW